MKLKDKVAIVTGGAHGLGEAYIKAYAEEGAKTVIADIDLEGARALEKALQKALEGLEKAHGGPFERRKEELKGGRPMK